MSLGDFHFLRPGWLLFAPIAMLVWWFYQRVSDPLLGWRSLVAPDLLDDLSTDTTHNQPKQFILLVGWLVGIVALAGPTWKRENSPFADDPVPVAIVLRAASSMELDDLSPSRLDRAQLKIVDLAELRKGQPTGLVAYAGSSHLVLPPTRDTAVVAEMAAELSPSIMPREGDDLLGALQTAKRSFGDRIGSIILILDNIDPSSESALSDFHEKSREPIEILAVARPNTPESEAIQQAAAGEANVTLITADTSDVESVVRRTAKLPANVEASSEETRWADSGWWFIPIVALIALHGFRRSSAAIDGSES